MRLESAVNFYASGHPLAISNLQRSRQNYTLYQHPRLPITNFFTSNVGSKCHPQRLTRRNRPSNNTPTVVVAAASASSTPFSERDDQNQRRIADALLLAFIACQNGSLFAGRCLIEVVLEAYRAGYSTDELKLALTFTTLSAGEIGDPIMLDALTAWIAIINMTLQTIGVPLSPYGQARVAAKTNSSSSAGTATADGGSTQVVQNEETAQETAGLQAFVRSCVDRFRSGVDMYRLQLQQGMGPGAEEGNRSPSVFVLKQNTRLSILTLQIVRDLGLPTTSIDISAVVNPPQEGEGGGAEVAAEDDDDDQEEEVDAPSPPKFTSTGFAYKLVDDGSEDSSTSTSDDDDAVLRASAVRLLLTFNGAAMSYLRAANGFVEAAGDAYSAGFTVDQLIDALHVDEFAQSGGILRFGLVARPPRDTITVALFARWLSVVYMSFAQMGVIFPSADTQVGWAWTSRAAASTSGTLDSWSSSIDDDSGGAGASFNTSADSGVDADGGSGSASNLQAYGLAEVVKSALKNAEESDFEGSASSDDSDTEYGRNQGGGKGVESESQAAVAAGAAAGGLDSSPSSSQEGFKGFSITGVEDPELAETSSFALMMSQMISLVRLARSLVIRRAAAERAAAEVVAVEN